MLVFKEIIITLFLPAGGAAVAPPLGPVLGQYGVNTVQFCNEYNEATFNLNLFFDSQELENSGEFILVVKIFIKGDKTCSFEICKPSISFLLRTLTAVGKGMPTRVVGVLTLKDLVYLALFKFPNLPLRSACNLIKGSARSIGIKIVYSR